MTKEISHLFFVLSTFELKHDLSQFKDPNVVLCRANNPEPLLTYSLKNARKCQVKNFVKNIIIIFISNFFIFVRQLLCVV